MVIWQKRHLCNQRLKCGVISASWMTSFSVSIHPGRQKINRVSYPCLMKREFVWRRVTPTLLSPHPPFSLSSAGTYWLNKKLSFINVYIDLCFDLFLCLSHNLSTISPKDGLWPLQKLTLNPYMDICSSSNCGDVQRACLATGSYRGISSTHPKTTMRKREGFFYFKADLTIAENYLHLTSSLYESSLYSTN